MRTFRKVSQIYFDTHSDEQHFNLSYGGETVSVSFQTGLFPELSSQLVFAGSVLSSVRLSSLTYGIVSIARHVTCITNEVLTSRHDCMFERYNCDYLDLLKILAGCTFHSLRCSMYPRIPYPFWTLHCTKYSHHYSREKYQCRCRLCVNDKPHSLKSLCVNKLHEKSSNNCSV